MGKSRKTKELTPGTIVYFYRFAPNGITFTSGTLVRKIALDLWSVENKGIRITLDQSRIGTTKHEQYEKAIKLAREMQLSFRIDL